MRAYLDISSEQIMMSLLLFWDSIFIVLHTITNVSALILDVVSLTSNDNGIVKSVVIAVSVVVFAVIIVVFIVLSSHSSSFSLCPVAFSINFNKDYNRKSI